VVEEVSRLRSTQLAAPFRGAAMSDLPPIGDLAGIDVPTLILAWPDDRSHPLSVARQLESSMPRAELDIAEGQDLGRWKSLMADFVAEVAPTGN
jgi:pimeloyl-ACP methyl ester carboxylesterase